MKTKIIFPLFIMLLLSLSVFAELTPTGQSSTVSNEGVTTIVKMSWWDWFNQQFDTGAVVTTAGTSLDSGVKCNSNYEGSFNKFTTTYTPTDNINVGGKCGTGYFEVKIYKCSDSSCSSRTYQTSGYINYNSYPYFKGWDTGATYGYLCYACFPPTQITTPAQTTTPSTTTPKCINIDNGYCISTDNLNCFVYDTNKEYWYTTYNECYYNLAYFNPVTNTIKKYYHISCQGDVCSCIEMQDGEYSDLTKCQYEAKVSSDMIKAQTTSTGVQPSSGTTTSTTTQTTSTQKGCCEYDFFWLKSYDCLDKAGCNAKSGIYVGSDICWNEISDDCGLNHTQGTTPIIYTPSPEGQTVGGQGTPIVSTPVNTNCSSTQYKLNILVDKICWDKKVSIDYKSLKGYVLTPFNSLKLQEGSYFLSNNPICNSNEQCLSNLCLKGYQDSTVKDIIYNGYNQLSFGSFIEKLGQFAIGGTNIDSFSSQNGLCIIKEEAGTQTCPSFIQNDLPSLFGIEKTCGNGWIIAIVGLIILMFLFSMMSR